MEAAKAASARPLWNTSIKSCAEPAPPDAITGMETASATNCVNSQSKPALVPSRSIEVSMISPAPQAAASSADRERNKQAARRAGDHIDHRAALIAGGRNIQQNDLVRAIAGVSGGTFRRVAGVAQINKLHALHDPAVVHIETGNDALGQHVLNLTEILEHEQPHGPRFFRMKLHAENIFLFDHGRKLR